MTDIENIAAKTYDIIGWHMNVEPDQISWIFEECLKQAEIAVRRGETVNLDYLGSLSVSGDPREVTHVIPTNLLEPL